MKELNRKRARIRILSPNSTHFRCHVSFFRFLSVCPDDEPGTRTNPDRIPDPSRKKRARQGASSIFSWEAEALEVEAAKALPPPRRVLANSSPRPCRRLTASSPPPRHLLAASSPPPCRLLSTSLPPARRPPARSPSPRRPSPRRPPPRHPPPLAVAASLPLARLLAACLLAARPPPHRPPACLTARPPPRHLPPPSHAMLTLLLIPLASSSPPRVISLPPRLITSSSPCCRIDTHPCVFAPPPATHRVFFNTIPPLCACSMNTITGYGFHLFLFQKSQYHAQPERGGARNYVGHYHTTYSEFHPQHM